ncbi:suppressor of fused domain protein [Crocinitomix algicola]|uniref:suppressor of fused domain protein n=1 Tax=Crocinitomix algicola TaxID=1740263 RepID=UPI00082C6C1C|nr:suppressor of fused domain protein [Crocinitomix algicola]
MLENALSTIDDQIIFETIQTGDNFAFDLVVVKLPQLKKQLVMTVGLSENEQEISSEKFKEYKRIEIFFCLPDYWKIDEVNWPVTWISKIAEIPQKNKTWFGPGDTIPAGNPPVEFMDKLPANHFMLCNPIITKSVFEHEKLKKLGIKFMGIIPITQNEVDFKLRNSATILTHRLTKKGYDETVDPFRSPVCRKRILGLF